MLDFYGAGWARFGTRHSLASHITAFTSIPLEILRIHGNTFGFHETRLSGLLADVSVAQKMSWASERQVTRPEDIAYCMMGLFGINMPLLYGEGGLKAFRRLQEEIIRSSVDESIYCWNLREPEGQDYYGLLARHPSLFNHDHCRSASRPRYMRRSERNITTMTGDGLQLKLLRAPRPIFPTQDIYLVVLACDVLDQTDSSGAGRSPILIVQRTSSWDESEFVRVRPDLIVSLNKHEIQWPSSQASTGGFGKGLEEPVLHQMYVPHGKPYLQQPRGVIFERPFVADIAVVEIVFGAWDQLTKWNEDVLVFEGKGSVTGGWTRTTAFGALRVVKPKVSGRKLQDPCLVVGRSPLPDNKLGLKPWYREFWVAFESLERTQRRDFSNLKTKRGRERNNRHAEPWKARLELQNRHSQLYYRIYLEANDVHLG